MKKVNPLIQWWMSPKLPLEHIFIPKDKRPKKPYEIFRLYSRKWLLHPIKRRVAKYYLLFLKRFFQIKVIAITGSCGKTTAKEIIASILSTDGETVATYANIDPVYNIPTTILKCKPRTKYLVLEMGVEYPGEMDYYLWLARPQIAVITNIYPTHTQFFKNISGVADEKIKLISGLTKTEYAVLNSENCYTKSFIKKTKGKVITFGIKGDIKAEKVKVNKNFQSIFTLIIGKRKTNIQMPILGKQFVSNALAAASVGHLLGLPLASIKKGVEKFNIPVHRMKLIRLKSKAMILDDSYNNNPTAAKEALATFLTIAKDKKRIIIFGDMLELGELEKKYHQQLGKRIANANIEYLIGVGKASRVLIETANKTKINGNYSWAKDWRQALSKVKPLLKNDTFCLVKGSRSIELDKLVSRLF